MNQIAALYYREWSSTAGVARSWKRKYL